MAAEVLSETGARGADRAQRRSARIYRKRFATVLVVRVQMQGSGAGGDYRARLCGKLFGRARHCGMLTITVERRLQQAVTVRQSGLLLPRRLV